MLMLMLVVILGSGGSLMLSVVIHDSSIEKIG